MKEGFQGERRFKKTQGWRWGEVGLGCKKYVYKKEMRNQRRKVIET